MRVSHRADLARDVVGLCRFLDAVEPRPFRHREAVDGLSRLLLFSTLASGTRSRATLCLVRGSETGQFRQGVGTVPRGDTGGADDESDSRAADLRRGVQRGTLVLRKAGS